jgi:hypothetical protein
VPGYQPGQYNEFFLSLPISNNFPRMQLVWLSHLHPDKIDAKFSEIREFIMKRILEMDMPEKTKTEYVDVSDHIKYKYLISVDGWTAAWLRPNWIMASNSLLIKQESPRVEWFTHLLKPYVHYYPVTNNLSNLLEVFDYLEAHQEEAQKIVQEANKFVDTYFTPESMTEEYCAVFRDYSQAQAEQKRRVRELRRQEEEAERQKAEREREKAEKEKIDK